MRTQREGTLSTSHRWALARTQLHWLLDLGSQPPKGWENNFWEQSHPACGILLWQLKLRHTHTPNQESLNDVLCQYLLALKLWNILWYYGHRKNPSSHGMGKQPNFFFFFNILQVKCKVEKLTNKRFLKLSHESEIFSYNSTSIFWRPFLLLSDSLNLGHFPKVFHQLVFLWEPKGKLQRKYYAYVSFIRSCQNSLKKGRIFNKQNLVTACPFSVSYFQSSFAI